MVAAGSGSRLGASLPKALVEVAGIPIVRRCVDNLGKSGLRQAVVMIPDGYQREFDRALIDCAIEVTCVVGGSERQDSVRLGLEALGTLDDNTVVLVHDAARPLVPAEVIERVREAVEAGAGAVIPTLPVVDSIREGTARSSVVRERSQLHAVQTPQGARFATLLQAHRYIHAHEIAVTDDAAACEAVGFSVLLVQGHRHSLKITEPLDLLLVEAILAEGVDQ